MKFRFCTTVAILFLLSQGASADVGTSVTVTPTPPRVTLESCGDLRAEDILRILAAEHQNFDYSQTRVMVSCTSTIATVRVIGPSNPRGRIHQADLSSVQPVAWPRTIALIVAELSPVQELAAPGLVAELVTPDYSAPEIVTTEEASTAEPAKRGGIDLGVGLLLATRSLHANELGVINGGNTIPGRPATSHAIVGNGVLAEISHPPRGIKTEFSRLFTRPRLLERLWTA